MKHLLKLIIIINKTGNKNSVTTRNHKELLFDDHYGEVVQLVFMSLKTVVKNVKMP